jgi:putative heme-binding domain-containing protein
LLALRCTEPTFAKPIILDLAKQYDGHDRFYLEAIGIAVGHHDKERRGIILADFEKHFPEWDDRVADLVWELQPPSVMATVGRRLVDPKLTADQKARVVDILALSNDPARGQDLLAVVLKPDVPEPVRERALECLRRYLPGKWSALQKTKELDEAITGLLTKPETRGSALDLIAAAEKVDAVTAVSALVADTAESAATRKSAVQTLGLLPSAEASATLAGLVGDAALAEDAVQALGKQAKRDGNGAKPALATLQAVATGKELALDLRKSALSALAGSRPGASWLLDWANKPIDPPAKEEAIRLLRNSSYTDLRNKAMVAFPPPGRLDLKNLPSLSQLATRRGDVERGRKLMAASVKNDLQCLKCHTALGKGGSVGPDLSTIGKKASRENLYESILYPSKAIADQYITWQIETKKGTSLVGLIVEETPDALTLRDGNGKDTKIAKGDVESRQKSPKSLMPEDLLVYMSEQDLVDMVEYLLTLK